MDEKVYLDRLLSFFEDVGKLGDIIVYKMDGLREANKYTVYIASGNMSFETIRTDAPTLEEAVMRVSREYEKIKNIRL
jgi:hypothetical protein